MSRAASIWASLGTKAKENGGLMVLGVGLGAAAGSALNILKGNTQRGTFALNADETTGAGGIDVDVLAGLAIAAVGAYVPNPMVGSVLLGAGVGLGTGILARESAVYAHDHQQNQLGQSTSGIMLGGPNLIGDGGLSSLASYGHG